MDNNLKKSIESILNAEDSLELVKLSELITQPIMPLKYTGIDSKVFNYWRKNNITSIPADAKQQWYKLDFQDIIWLYIVDDLRKFKLSIEVIQTIKKTLFDTINPTEFGETIENVKKGKTIIDIAKKKQIDELLEKITQNLTPEEKEIVIHSLDADQIENTIKTTGFKFTLLNSMVLSSIINRQEVGLLCYPDGKFFPFLDEFIDYKIPWNKILFTTHLYISITSQFIKFLNSVLTSEGLDKLKKNQKFSTQEEEVSLEYVSRFGLLNPVEVEILRLLKDKNIKIIEITKENDTGSLLVKVSSSRKLTPKEFEASMHNLIIDKFSAVEIIRGNDGMIHLKIKKTKKIKK
jgi:hypothetical protein